MLIAQIEADVKHTFFSSDTLAHGIGWMNEETWQKTVKTLVEQGAMKQTIDASKAFADKYLAAASSMKQ